MTDQVAYCMVSFAPIRGEKRDASEQVSQLLFGEPVSIVSIESPWCKISTYFDNYEGYIDEKQVRIISKKELNRWLDGIHFSSDLNRTVSTPWGNQQLLMGSFLPWGNPANFSIGKDQFIIKGNSTSESVNSPVEVALSLLNVPYVWGGKSTNGIDCSGLIQLVFRLFEVNLPRDAYQQAEYGSNVAFEQRQSGDVAFFSNSVGKITHVGILEKEDQIIHASGRVRIDEFRPQGIWNNDLNILTHNLSFIKRMI